MDLVKGNGRVKAWFEKDYEVRTLYSGPRTGFFTPIGFDDLVRNSLRKQLGCSEVTEFRRDLQNVAYFFPNTGIGVIYGELAGDITSVDLLIASRGRDNADKVQRLLSEKARK